MEKEKNKSLSAYKAFLVVAFLVTPFLFSFGLATNMNEDYRSPSLTSSKYDIPRYLDINENRIHDGLEEKIGKLDSQHSMVIVVVFNELSSSSMIQKLSNLGRLISVHLPYAGLQSATVETTVGNIQNLTTDNDILFVEENVKCFKLLDESIPQIRARPYVWDTLGYTGSSTQTVAILDTGVDDSHPDLSGKIVYWQDFVGADGDSTTTGDFYTTPTDRGEHGTHVSSIVGGTGAANTLQGTGYYKQVISSRIPSNYLSVYINPVYVEPYYGGTITVSIKWQASGFSDAIVAILDSNQDLIDFEIFSASTFVYQTTVNRLGWYWIGVGNAGGAGNQWFTAQVNVPYIGNSDGYNLFTGVAPTVGLVGLKVLGDKGYGDLNGLLNALDWVFENGIRYGVIAVSMSLGFDEQIVSLDNKVNQLVEAGFLVVSAAGNDGPSGTINSPGSAAKGITVGAVNEYNSVTTYSSVGDGSAPYKPDVLAPAGSFETLNGILAADSNDADDADSIETSQIEDPVNDGYPDDYRAGYGTSMAAPHVSGLAALIGDALGWTYNQQFVLKVKMIILMTAFEVHERERGYSTPPLDRGSKDIIEGYGRICADAALEAATLILTPDSPVSDSFGFSASSKKVLARQANITAGYKYTFDLTVPSGADYDLYLYSGLPDINGDPVILANSISPVNGIDEQIVYEAESTGIFYVVAKWVDGSGSFTLSEIFEPVPPIIDNPDDITYELGTTGHVITWSPIDFNPASCIITMDDTVVASGSWNGGPITINVDLLPVGTYTYTCTVYDQDENSDSDSVKVTVKSEDSGFPLSTISLALAGIAIAAVLTVVLVKYKH